MQSKKRIQSEYKDYFSKGKDHIKEIQCLEFDTHNLRVIVLLLHGPSNTPYEGFSFRIKIQGLQRYPYGPPKVKFMEPVWNPFVDFSTGNICCDILYDNWSPAMTALRSLPLSILSLLAETKISQDGLNMQATFDMKNNYEKFFQQAREYAEKHCYMKKTIYIDEEKVPNFVPKQKKLKDEEYIKKKEEYLEDEAVKKLVGQKKIKLSPKKEENREDNMKNPEEKRESVPIVMTNGNFFDV